MFPFFVAGVAQARLDDLHRQAQRDALAQAARRARRRRHGNQESGLLAIVARWQRRRRDTTGLTGVRHLPPAPTGHDSPA